MLGLCLGWARPVPQGSCSRHSVVCGHFGLAACSGQQPATHFYCVLTLFLIKDFLFVYLFIVLTDADSGRPQHIPEWALGGPGQCQRLVPGQENLVTPCTLHSPELSFPFLRSSFFLPFPQPSACSVVFIVASTVVTVTAGLAVRMRVGQSGFQAGLHCFFIDDCAPWCLSDSSVKWEEQCCTP